jgi:hypothetical protein
MTQPQSTVYTQPLNLSSRTELGIGVRATPDQKYKHLKESVRDFILQDAQDLV